MAEILHPMIYDGPKAEKRVEVTGRLEAIIFKAGPLSEQPGPLAGKKYADVTEKEGRALQRRAPALFKWPEGTVLGPQLVSREEYDALLVRVEALELATAKAAPAADEPEAPKSKKKAKAAPAADEPEAPAVIEPAVPAEAPAPAVPDDFQPEEV